MDESSSPTRRNVASVAKVADASLADIADVQMFLGDTLGAMEATYDALWPDPKPARTNLCASPVGGIKVETDRIVVPASGNASR